MDYNFDDILKEFGVGSEYAADEPAEEEEPASRILAEADNPAKDEAGMDLSLDEDVPKGEAGDTPVKEEEAPAAENDPFAAWAEAERSIAERQRARKKASAEKSDEFHFDWPEPEKERTEPVKRNYDPEKYPDAIKAKAREKAREEKEAEQQRRELERQEAAREKAVEKAAEKERRENERRASEQEKLSRARRKAEEQERTRQEKEREKTARYLQKEREREEAKAARDAQKRAALNAKDASRAAKEREKEQSREYRRREKEAYNRRHFQERRQGTIALIIFLVVIALFGAGVLYAGRTIATNGKNMPNVYVDEVAVGNLTRQQTQDALIAAGWQDRAATPLTVRTYNGLSIEVDPTQAGTVMSLENAVDAACSYGHDGNLIENVITFVQSFLSHVDVNRINTALNTGYLQQKAAELGEMLTASLGDTEYTVDAQGGKLIVVKGQGSMALDTHALYEAIAAALQKGEKELSFGTLSSEPVMPDFAAIYTELAADPVDARYSDDGRFTVIPETIGCWFDVEGARAAWQQAQPGETVTIPVQVTSPATTAAMLEGRLYHDLLGAMTTKYTNSGPNRCSNVRLATSMINGMILYPGEVFSYNETVGARTEAAGFLPAPAYTGVGEDAVKDEIGGGACQVSSTLYCASIYAFLETVERTAHIYPVNYIQMGTDATVTIPEDGGTVMDMKFKNSKNYPIKIVGYTEETDELKTVTFEIWGTLEDGDYMPIEFDNTYYWMMDYDRVIEPAYPDREGYKIKFSTERFGFEDTLGYGTRTLTHRVVYDSYGNKVFDEIINPKIASGYAMDTYYNHE